MEITRFISSAIYLSICPLVLGVIATIIVMTKTKKNLMRSLLLVSISTLVFVFICSAIGVSSSFSGAPSPLFKPNISSIEGTYNLKNSVIENLYKQGYPVLQSDSFIILENDKTLKVQKFPDIIINESNPLKIYWSGNGTWDLVFDNSNREWYVSIKFKNEKGEIINSYLWIYGRKSPFVLYSILGDPDSLNWIMFLKN
jgi:hypothetical protein